MGNVLLISPRESDLAVLAASSQVSTLPVAFLQAMQPQKKWRSTGTTEWITVELATAVAATAVSLVGHNLSSGATIRVRSGTTAANVTASPTGDVTVSAWPTSGKPTVPNWPNYLSLVTFNDTTPVRYWRIDIADAGNAAGYLEAGRLVIGAAWQPTTNFDLGGTPYGFNTLDIQVTTPTGYTFTDRRSASAPRTIALTITGADQREVLDGIAEIQRLRGMWGDVICCLDPAATTDFHRQSLQGVFTAKPNFPIVQQFTANGVMYGATLPIIELL